MNVAVVTPWHVSPEAVGGTERFTIDIASGLADQGHNVEVFTISGQNTEINAIPYTSLDLLGNGSTANEYDLRRIMGPAINAPFYDNLAVFLESHLSADRFDTIQLNSFLFANAWKDTHRLLTIHTNPFEYQLDWGQSALQPLVDIVTHPANNELELVAPSAHYGSVFSDMFSRYVHVVPHAIDLSRLQHQDERDDKMTSILVPSRLEPTQKRPQIVFEAVAELEQAVRSTITVMATGKDEQYVNNEKPLRAIATKYGFQAVFGRCTTMAQAYAQADIVALPSMSESFGYSALEALSLGKPTILSSIPTFKEIGEGNPNAHFFDGTSSGFAAVLSSILEDLEPRPVCKSWYARYDPKTWAQTYEQLLRGGC